MKIMQAVNKAPRAMPGTKPAAKDLPENEPCDDLLSVGDSFVLAASVAVEVGPMLTPVDAVLVVDEDWPDAASAAVCATHTFAPLQV